MALTNERLTQQAFDRLMATLAEDREEAGRRYERLRQRLLKFFAWRRCAQAEECADEVMNRVARRVAQDVVVQGSIEGFALGVAQFVWREMLKQPRAAEMDEARLAARAGDPEADDARERESACLERCLGELGPQARKWVEAFYQESGREGIRRRETLAADLGIDMNALRVRMYRIRAKLEVCVTGCLGARVGAR